MPRCKQLSRKPKAGLPLARTKPPTRTLASADEKEVCVVVSESDESNDVRSSTSSKPVLPKKARKTQEAIGDEKSLIGAKFSDLLKKVEIENGSGEFVVSGSLPSAPITGISLKDGIIMKFPLLESELPTLIPKFEQSPFGRGEETVVDVGVRNSWQLGPDDFKIQNPKWDNFITDNVVPLLQNQLGLTTSFVPTLYKLLLYKSGSFFKPHRDSEKGKRMFATLVIQLPSNYTGGQLVVHHDGAKVTNDFSGQENQFTYFYSAFYCDCDHEILPLITGVRACLIYNLCLTGKSKIPNAPKLSAHRAEFEALLDNWKTAVVHEDADDKAPAKIIYVLAHQYSNDSLDWENLKGSDKALTLFLRAFPEQVKLFLGILDIKVVTPTDCGSDIDSSDDEYVDRDIHLQSLLPLPGILEEPTRGKPEKIGMLSCYKPEVVPYRRWRNLKPFSKKTNHTGNEGTTVTKQFRHSGLAILLK